MKMTFEELDEITRRYMLNEFEVEQAGGQPYIGRDLSSLGKSAFPSLTRDVIRFRDEDSLKGGIAVPRYWNPTERYVRNGISRERRINIEQVAERLALTEFNTWYVRGFAKRLMAEGFTHCRLYRAGIPKWEMGECSVHEGQVFVVEDVYRGHRAKYWPTENPHAFSIPFGPGCHHTIGRIANN